MSQAKNLNEQIEEILQPLNEMSMAWSYKDRRIDVCAWVENPTTRDNLYFKYYNSSFYNLADKVARIRLDKPEYVGGTHSEGNKQKWILTKSEVKQLVSLLQMPSELHEGLTRWQDILITYNHDNFMLLPKDTINGNLDKARRNPTMPDYIQPFNINYAMPNYMELQNG